MFLIFLAGVDAKKKHIAMVRSMVPIEFLIPLCVTQKSTEDHALTAFGASELFDRNVMGIIVQFLVCCVSMLSRSPVSVQGEPTPRLLCEWGSEGQAPGQFSYPCGMGVGDDMVFVVDTRNHRIQTFRSDGTAVMQWGSQGSADGQFECPTGLAVLARSQDRDHPTHRCLFVTDTNNNRVQVLSAVDGTCIRKWGSCGQGDGQFCSPYGIAVRARSQDRGHLTQDLVYVADVLNDRVQVFGLDGTFVRKWGTRGSRHSQFKNPSGVAVHPTRDLIFISEDWGYRIQAFRSDGTFLFAHGSRGAAEGQFCSPRHLALHPTRDLLFVTDWANDCVQVFDLGGVFLYQWNVSFPAGIAVHPTRDQVLVSGGHKISVFELFSPRPRRVRNQINPAL